MHQICELYPLNEFTCKMSLFYLIIKDELFIYNWNQSIVSSIDCHNNYQAPVKLFTLQSFKIDYFESFNLNSNETILSAGQIPLFGHTVHTPI